MRTTLAGLEVQVLQRTAGAPTGAVVLCHGFGAGGDDLVPLHDELVARAPGLASVRFFFPAAPLALDRGGHSRAWWLIDVPTISRLASDPSALREFRREEPPGMAVARATMLKLVDEAVTGSGLAMNRLVLGGFSQGAMITTDVALRTEEACAGLAVLSGTLLLEDTWKQKAARRTTLPVFQAHGRFDPLLPYGAAEDLRDLLTTAGLTVQFFPFNGPHTITGGELDALSRFLEASLAGNRT
jgi:phospholipase/carboxylesterase